MERLVTSPHAAQRTPDEFVISVSPVMGTPASRTGVGKRLVGPISGPPFPEKPLFDYGEGKGGIACRL